MIGTVELFLACSGTPAAGDAEPACLPAPLPSDCGSALYGLQPDGSIRPTFQEVLDNTLSVCASKGCHRGADAPHGFRLDDIDVAYDALLATNAEGERRLVPGDLACGKVLVRVSTAGKSWSMPPDNPLDAPNLCAFQHWIENGAQR